eukprot:gene8-109_t
MTSECGLGSHVRCIGPASEELFGVEYFYSTVEIVVIVGVLLMLMAPYVSEWKLRAEFPDFPDFLGFKTTKTKKFDHEIHASKLFTATISHCAKTGDIFRAEEIFASMSEKKMTPNVKHFNSLLDVCGKASNLERAEFWYSEMLKTPGVTPDVITFTSLITCCVSGGKLWHAERWCNTMISYGIKPDIVTYANMIDTCSKAGKPEDAEAWFERMRCDGIIGIVPYNVLLDAHAKAGNVERALYWLENMTDVPPNMITFNSVIDACGKRGDLETAEKVMLKLHERGLKANTITYNAMIHACQKEPLKAEFWFSQMAENNCPPDVISYSTMINSYAQNGKADTALKWLTKMEAEGVPPNIWSFNAAIHAQVKSEDFHKLNSFNPVAWLKRIRMANCQPTVVTYTTLCQPASKSGDYQTVELLMAMLNSDGLKQNNFCLVVRINAYSNARPRQSDLAAKAFVDGVKKYNLRVNDVMMRSLTRCVGAPRAVKMCEALGVDKRLIEKNFDRTFLVNSATTIRRPATPMAIL